VFVTTDLAGGVRKRLCQVDESDKAVGRVEPCQADTPMFTKNLPYDYRHKNNLGDTPIRGRKLSDPAIMLGV
jgi:hypothetical protein